MSDEVQAKPFRVDYFSDREGPFIRTGHDVESDARDHAEAFVKAGPPDTLRTAYVSRPIATYYMRHSVASVEYTPISAPAQHGELRDVPPASERSGYMSFADFQKMAERMESERRLMRMKEALNSSDQQTEKSALGYSSGNDQGDGLEALPGGVEESRDQPCTCHPDDAPLECMKRYAASECRAAYGAKYFPPAPAEDFTLLDPAVLRDEPDGVEAEPEGYAPVVDAEAILDATELAQVTIDKVPPTAEVIKDQTGRAKFALFGGQTHEVVEPSNTEADFWARALFPKKKEQA